MVQGCFHILTGDECQPSQESLRWLLQNSSFPLGLYSSAEKLGFCLKLVPGDAQVAPGSTSGSVGIRKGCDSPSPLSSLKSCLVGKPRGFATEIWGFKGSFPLGILVWGTRTVIPVGISCCTFVPITRIWCFHVSRRFSCFVC